MLKKTFYNIFCLIGTRLFLLGAFILVSNHSFSQDNNNIIRPHIKNESGLKVTPITAVRSENDFLGASYCSGKLFRRIDELENFGITDKRLKESVMCTAGDFDGNGYLDFAFWGIDSNKRKSVNSISYDLENYLVLFFKGPEVIRKIKIKIPKYFPLVYYKPRMAKGKSGEPISRNDALWVWGETDGYDDYSKGMVYLYNNESQKFRVVFFGKKK